MEHQLAGFPRELESHFSDRIDRLYLTLLIINYVVFFSLVGYLQSRPPMVVSEQALKEYIQAIYSVPVEKKVEEVPEPVEKSSTVGRKLESLATESAADREKRREAKRTIRAEQLKAAREAARQHGIFAAAGAKGGARKAVGGTKALGSGLGGVDTGKLQGLATSSGEVEAIEKLRGGGAITEGSGEIDATKLSMKELNILLQSSVVEVQDIPVVTSPGAPVSSRSTSDIVEMANQESRRLTNCYNTQRKKDPNLRGKIVVQFKIMADGAVRRVTVKDSQWSNPDLGRLVEDCIKKRISRWRFNPADTDDVRELSLNFVH